MRKNVKFKDDRFNLKQKKEDVRWIQRPHFSDREAGFLVFKSDEHDDQDCSYQLNQNVKTETYKLKYVS